MAKSKEPDFFSKQVAQARRFYLQKSQSKDSRIKVVCAGCEHTNPDFEIDRKDFPYYCIEFVAKGKGVAVLNNREYELKTGTIFSYGPGISQHITCTSDKPMIKYFIDFTGPGIKQMLKKYVSPPGSAIYIKRPDEIAMVFDKILDHGLSDSQYKSLTCSILLEYLFYRIAEISLSDIQKPTKAYNTYHTCRQIIKEQFMTLHSLEDIAEVCMIDPAYLCRLFKRFDTQSPYQYLLSQKMAYAADRFQKSEVLVKEVAYELGFSDPFHFTRVFKNVFGVSPQTFKGLR